MARCGRFDRLECEQLEDSFYQYFDKRITVETIDARFREIKVTRNDGFSLSPVQLAFIQGFSAAVKELT